MATISSDPITTVWELLIAQALGQPVPPPPQIPGKPVRRLDAVPPRAPAAAE